MRITARATVRALASALIVAATAGLAAAQTSAPAARAGDGVPRFDVTPGCRAGTQSGINARANMESCIESENAARDKLVKEWSQFVAADRVRCVDETNMGGPPSYVEVLTCLEMARDARALRRDKGDTDDLSIGLTR